MQAAEPAEEKSAGATASAAVPKETPESTAPSGSEEQAGVKEAPAEQPEPEVAAAAVAEAAPAADGKQREKAPDAPAPPSGNAFASFAVSNSKGGFGTPSAGTAAASISFGNGTSLGMLETLPPKPLQSHKHGRQADTKAGPQCSLRAWCWRAKQALLASPCTPLSDWSAYSCCACQFALCQLVLCCML